MQTPPSFNKKSEKNTYIAKLSTTMNTQQEYFLPSGLNPSDFPTPNDSFSFNKKSKDIFNPLENFSSVKKETPKFGKAENHLSTPTKDMIEKLTKIRNHFRWKKNCKEVFHHKKDAKDESQFGQLFKEKAGVFSNKIKPRVKLGRYSHKNTPDFHHKNDGFSENSSFLSKGKRVSSSKKRIKKSPKILGKNHLEFFYSNFANNINKSPQKLKEFSLQKEQKNSENERLKYKKRKIKIQNKEMILTKTGQKIKLGSKVTWPKMFEILPKSNFESKNQRIKAKHLPKNFQEDFLISIKNSFRNPTNNSVFKSPTKENRTSKLDTTKDKNSDKKKCDYSSRKTRGRKLNLRYQSAQKPKNLLKKAENFDLRARNPGKLNIDNQFLMRELRFMIDKKKRQSTTKKKPILPFVDFNMKHLFN